MFIKLSNVNGRIVLLDGEYAYDFECSESLFDRLTDIIPEGEELEFRLLRVE